MLKKLSRYIVPVLAAAVFLAAAAALPAGAEDFTTYGAESSADDDPGGYGDPVPTDTPAESSAVEPVWTVVPETTEVTEPEPEWTDPPYEESYEEEETESPRDEYAQLLDDAQEPTGINSVKMDKSVSNKTYSTDYIAGIVSWICVGVGLVVVMVMLISTKIGGRGATRA